jgi:type II restriction enzyme
MNLELSGYFKEASYHYKSSSQIARVVSEKWFLDNAYCPACSEYSLKEYPANNPVIDFYCECCNQDYQLKGSKKTIGRKVLDGQFDTMMLAVRENRLPNFAFITYDLSKMSIKELFFIPKYFFSSSIIEKRKALSPTARRAPYIGCNILFVNIPEIAKIHAVKNGAILGPQAVHSSWNKIAFMSEIKNHEARGWTSDVIKCVDLIPSANFNLQDCYKFETTLKKMHPDNINVRPKIRQQLQILRDKGIIEFLGNGTYIKK